MEQNFVHLRLHTEYSLSDSIINIPSLMEKIAADSMPAIAITDLSNLYATIKFYQAAFEAGIKPLIGVDLFIANDKEAPTRLTLLCQNHEGYQNLLKLISKSYLEGQSSGKPLVERDWLSSLSAGLIALSGAQEGDIGTAILAQDLATAESHLRFWQALFPDRFYIEISRVGKAQENDYINAAIKLAETFAIPVVATNDVRFLQSDDFEAHEARVCIQEGVTLNDPQRSRLYTEQQYLRSQREMQALFADIPEALANSVEIAKRCNVMFTLGKNKLPHFVVPKGYTAETTLCELSRKG